MDTARIKINIESGEIEIEGTEVFVKDQISNLPYLIEVISQVQLFNDEDEEVTELIEKNVKEQEKRISRIGESGLEIPETFGEWLSKFNEELQENDYALIAAYYTQKQSEENDCTSLDVSKILKEHGRKLSNTSQTLNRLTSKKYMFQTRKQGRIKFLRVSADGIKNIKTLLMD